MENEKQTTMNYMETEIGTQETQTQLEPKDVTIEDVRFELVKPYGDKLVLLCKHPDVADKLIEISKSKYLSKETLKTGGLWLKLDDQQKLNKLSATALLLAHYGAQRISQLKGKTAQTVLDENGYLAIKSY